MDWTPLTPSDSIEGAHSIRLVPIFRCETSELDRPSQTGPYPSPKVLGLRVARTDVQTGSAASQYSQGIGGRVSGHNVIVCMAGESGLAGADA